jgi:hypothetical protein
VLTLPYAATVVDDAGLLLLPYWKPKASSDYQANLQVIQVSVDDGTYSTEEGITTQAKLFADDFEVQQAEPWLCY